MGGAEIIFSAHGHTISDSFLNVKHKMR